jgi:hypothetical protein
MNTINVEIGIIILSLHWQAGYVNASPNSNSQIICSSVTEIWKTKGFKGILKKKIFNQTLVAHSYNLSYSGGRDQDDHGSKPPLGK